MPDQAPQADPDIASLLDENARQQVEAIRNAPTYDQHLARLRQQAADKQQASVEYAESGYLQSAEMIAKDAQELAKQANALEAAAEKDSSLKDKRGEQLFAEAIAKQQAEEKETPVQQQAAAKTTSPQQPAAQKPKTQPSPPAASPPATPPATAASESPAAPPATTSTQTPPAGEQGTQEEKDRRGLDFESILGKVIESSPLVGLVLLVVLKPELLEGLLGDGQRQQPGPGGSEPSPELVAEAQKVKKQYDEYKAAHAGEEVKHGAPAQGDHAVTSAPGFVLAADKQNRFALVGHADGSITSYQNVDLAVTQGQTLAAGATIGEILPQGLNYVRGNADGSIAEQKNIGHSVTQNPEVAQVRDGQQFAAETPEHGPMEARSGAAAAPPSPQQQAQR